MVRERTISSRRDALLDQLGGQPGRYAVVCVVLAVLSFPFHLLLDKGDPTASVIANSGLQGAMYALIPLTAEWFQRARRKAGAPTASLPSERRAWARRGAIVGLGVGMPFFSALLALCLLTGQSWLHTTGFGIILFVLLAVAVRSVRRSAEASTI